MTSHRVNFYFNLLGNTPNYENLFSSAYQLWADQLTFSKLVPTHLAQYCSVSRILNGKLTIIVENGAVASKLKQSAPSLMLKLQMSGWKITAIQILVQAPYSGRSLKHLTEKRHINRKLKLSQTGRDCLDQLAITLPESELRGAIRQFLEKHPSH